MSSCYFASESVATVPRKYLPSYLVAKLIQPCLDVLETFLDNGDYLVGNRVTAADIFISSDLFALDIEEV